MHDQPVHWSEGLFLLPQHFQAADRWRDRQLARAVLWGQPHAYGFYELSPDKEALKSGVLRVSDCSARLRDGAAVVGEEWTRDAPDLDDALKGHPEGVTAYLAVPMLRPNEGNVSSEREWRRYRLTTGEEVLDENCGDNPRPVQFRRLDARLKFKSELPHDCEALPVVRVLGPDRDDPQPHWDPKFVPPLLRCGAWPAFHRDFATSVRERLRREGSLLAAPLPELSAAAPDAGNLGRVLLLAAINRGESRFAVLARAPGIHPFSLYLELCALAGDLALFASDGAAPEFPAYNHDDLGACFSPLKDFLTRVLNAPRGTQAPPVGGMLKTNEPKE
jgi:type VI secretion system protein ImpJ